MSSNLLRQYYLEEIEDAKPVAEDAADEVASMMQEVVSGLYATQEKIIHERECYKCGHHFPKEQLKGMARWDYGWDYADVCRDCEPKLRKEGWS